MRTVTLATPYHPNEPTPRRSIYGFDIGFVDETQKDGRPALRKVRVGSPFQSNYGYHARYPDLASGDCVRMMDGLYQLSPKLREFIRVKRSELPEGITATERSYPFPIGGGGSLHYRLIGIKDEFSKDKNGNIQIIIWVSGKRTDPKHARQKVKEGDLLWLGRWAHRVEKIVLSDPKRKLIGWVDIDQGIARLKE